MSARARIPVELYFDEELGTWHFHVDEPRVVGGGQATLEEARQAAAEAIAFARRGRTPTSTTAKSSTWTSQSAEPTDRSASGVGAPWRSGRAGAKVSVGL